MKVILLVILVAGIIGLGAASVTEQKKITKTLDEAVRFISFVKSELNYRASDFEDLFRKGKEQNYRYINFADGEITLDASVGKVYTGEFSDFISNIGTTDETGQLSLCDEYSKRFCRYFDERCEKEKEKIQVNTAVTVLGAVCAVVFFL